jgi:hypothetical protein
MNTDDIQTQDAEEDYAKPFGVSESKTEALGFLDANPIVKPRAITRIARWLHDHIYRPWQ